MLSLVRLSFIACIGLIPNICVAQESTVTIAPTISPTGKPVSLSFPGFAFEQAAFYNYSFTASGDPNTFSSNLIKRAGPAPVIRVGGTSGDRAHFNASQHNATNYPATDFGTAFKAPFLAIGRPFFEAFKNFDAIGAKYIFQVPWDRGDIWRWQEEGYQNGLVWAAAGLSVVGLERLEALEIGNEPNYYQGITPTTYANRYRDFQSSLLQRLPQLQGKRIFQAMDIADGAASAYETQSFFDAGLDAVAPSIKQVAFHYYQGTGVNNVAELQDWVSHARTVKQLGVFKNDISYLRKTYGDSIRFVLDESADNVGQGSVQATIYNNLATALWRVDFMLHAMAIGVDRVNWQQIFNDKICMWLPVKSGRAGAPRVLPDYYAVPFAADFIGTSGQTHVLELDVTASGTADTVGYAAYDDGKLARIALMHLEIWRSGERERPEPTIYLKVGRGYNRAIVRRLGANEGALAKQGISWAGLQWTWENQGAPMESEETEELQLEQGVLAVRVAASSAIMISLL